VLLLLVLASVSVASAVLLRSRLKPWLKLKGLE